jgi:hypothetical protein
MINLNWVIPGFILICGILLMLWTTRSNRKLFIGQEISFRKYLINSALYGLWIFLISVGIILLIGSVNKGYQWTTSETLRFLILGFAAGILGMFGSLWQFFLVSEFRESLYKYLKLKVKK